MNKSLRKMVALLFALLLACPALAQESARTWTSKDGGKTLTATFLGFSGEKVRLRYSTGKVHEVNPNFFSDADKKYLAGLKAKPADAPNDGEFLSRSRLTSAERKHLLASEVLAAYKRANELGQVAPADKAYVDSKIEEFEQLAAIDAVNLEGSFVAEKDIASRRDESRKIVERWVKAASSIGGKQKMDQLRAATKLDPISLDAAILQGLYAYFYERDREASVKHFKDAARRGERYSLLHNDVDKKNYLCALENGAVVSVCENNMKKAFEYWRTAVSLDSEVSESMKENLARVGEFLRAGNIGVTTSKSELKKLQVLAAELGVRPSARNGWRFSAPFNSSGERLSDITFLVGNLKETVGTIPTGLEDYLCLVCTGAIRMECPIKGCNNGAVTEMRMVEIETAAGSARVQRPFPVECKRCRGNGHVKCWGCVGTGKQKK